MTLVVLLGATAGAGAALLLSAASPRPVALAAALDRLHRPRPRSVAGPTSSVTRLLGSSWAGTAAGRRLTSAVGADLRLVGHTPEEHLARLVTVTLMGVLWAPAAAALMRVGGVAVPVVLPVWVSLVLGVVAFFVPSVSVRADAARRRRSFRHALSSFLDVLAVSLAGGKGVEGALVDAANAGQGWAFAELRRALLEASLRGETPWAGLDRLGVELEVPELRELAATAALAGDEGARVRTSIAAKARALRLRGLTDIEAAAQSASERMSLPVVLLMVGFVAFLGYPAVVQVLTGL